MKNSTLHFNFKWLLTALLLLGLVPASQAQNVMFQSFDGATFPPAGTVAGTSWKINNSYLGSSTTSYPGDSIWNRVPTSALVASYSGSFSTNYGTAWTYIYGPYSHTTGSSLPTDQNTGGAVFYPCYYTTPGSHGDLVTPPLNFSSFGTTGTFTVSFWVSQYSLTTSSPPNSLDVYVNTAATSTGGTLLTSITPMISPQPAPYNTNYSEFGGYHYGQWKQYVVNIPASYNIIPAVYIIFRGNCNVANAGDMQMDDVSVDYIPPCNNTPAAPSIISGPMSTGICAGTTATIVAADAVYSPGISYIWQDSVRGGTWTTVGVINGIAGLQFVTPGLFDTTYTRLIDSCQQSHAKTVSTNIYKVPVIKNSIPYLETFNTTANTNLPACYSYNDNYSTNWQVQSGWHSADGTAMTSLLVANDPASNAAYGKNDFFTLPGLTLNGGANIVYAIRFKYARGKDNPYANTGVAYAEHLQVFANSVTPGYQVSRVTGGTLLFDRTINFDNVADTTIYFAPPANGGYYLSWYSNTPHPSSGGGSPVSGGTIGVDSIYVNVGTCVPTAFTAQPQNVGVCIGRPATLSAVVAGTGNTYQWKKNGVNIAGANQASYTIPTTTGADGNTYSLAVFNPCGSIISNTATLTINPLPIPNISPATSTTICSADGAVATAVPAGNGPFSYIWRRNDTVVSGTGTTFAPTISANYSYVVTDGNGCTATSGESPFIVNPSPSAIVSPSGPTSFCNGDSVTLNANTAAGLTYQWLAGGIPINGATNYNYKAKNSVGYSVKVTLGNCNTTSLVTNVSVTAAPVTTITNTGSLSFCGGGSVTLNAAVSTGYTYQWRLNGGNINGTNHNYTATQAGVYDVVVTSGVCSGPSTNSLTVAVIPSPTAFITNARPLTFCTGDSTILNAQPDLTNTYTYAWKLNGVNISGASNTTGTYTAYGAGSYTVNIVNSSNCGAITPNATVTVNSLPIVSLTGSPSICSGLSTTLSATTGTGFTYQWRQGTAAINGANGAAYSVSAAGSYSVLLTDANGCKATSAPIVVTANPLPTATLTAGAATSFCPGGSVVLTAASDIGSPTWKKDGLPIAGISPGTTTYTASVPGSYTVDETAVGCVQTTAPVTVINYAVPAATISAGGPTTFCPGGNVVLSTPTIVGYTYQWKNSGGNITTGGTNSGYTATTAEIYRVTVTSDNGCVNTSTGIPVSTIAAPLATIAATGPTTFCNGDNVVLNANTGTGLTYTWKNNNINLPNGNTASYTATASGVYTVVIANVACNVTSAPATITVNPLPVVNTGATGPTTFCSNSNVTLTSTLVTGYTYQWLRNGAAINGAQGASYTTDTTGTYSVVVTNTNGCVSTSSNIPVTVNQAPAATITSPGSTTLCAGDTSHLSVSAGAGTYQYQWYANGSPIPGATYQAYNAVSTSTYTAKVTSGNGCSATATPLSLIFSPAPNPVITGVGVSDTLSVASAFATYQWYLNGVVIPGATRYFYIANKSGQYTVYVTSATCSGMSAAYLYPPLGVANVSGAGSDVSIYPNPAASVVHIEAPVKVNVIITSIEGKELIRENNVTEVNIDLLANGVYLITVYDHQNNSILKISKLVKAGR